MIELRSDTFTLPTPAMLTAISNARLGNDGYREDPTVIELEYLAASRLGKEAACLMPSGTMANLACIMAHSSPDKNHVLVGDWSDIYIYERSGAELAGVIYRELPTQPNGTIQLSDLDVHLQNTESERSRIGLLCLENPHNLCGGPVLTASYLRQVAYLVHPRNVHLHLDGARIFNAAVALGIDAATLVQEVDSIQFCLSKSLCAPIGSLAIGSSLFIEKVRRIRKTLGGTMRQAGIIAAAGIVALKEMIPRLTEDHRNARRLAEGLALMPAIKIDLTVIQTNCVVFQVVDNRFTPQSFIASAWASGVHFSEFKNGRIRGVVHYGTRAKDIDDALQIVAQVFEHEPITNIVLSLAKILAHSDFNNLRPVTRPTDLL